MHTHLGSASLARFLTLIRHVIFFLMFTTYTLADMQNAPQLESPPLVRLTGAFSKLEEIPQSGPSTLQVSIQNATWSFTVVKFEKLTGRAATDLDFLQSLFPPQLRLTGAPAVLAPLQQPTILGKSLVIEGRFYSTEKMLLVLSVTDSQQQQKK